MKKNNIKILSLLSVLVIGICVYAFFINSGEKNYTNESSSISEKTKEETSNETTRKTVSETKTQKAEKADPTILKNALFIGDSRTVGIMEYGNLTNADFFCTTGMSVFKVCSQRVSVKNIGKVTLDELLSNKSYDNIYLMLGINELGYNFQSIIDQYAKVLDFIKERQNNAVIFIEANLHVSKNRSESDKIINNENINKLNRKTADFANNKNVFYLDANILFDDENGNLASDKTQDDAHPLGVYYLEWGEWIINKTAQCTRGNEFD